MCFDLSFIHAWPYIASVNYQSVMQICFLSSYLLRYFPTGIALLPPPPWKAPISLVGISILIVLAVFQFTAKLKLRINQSCVYFCSASGVFFLQTIYCSSQQHRAGETYASERCTQLCYCLLNTPCGFPFLFQNFACFLPQKAYEVI
jgi:hypothetical protein